LEGVFVVIQKSFLDLT